MKSIFKAFIIIFITLCILQAVGFSLSQTIALLFMSLFLRSFIDNIFPNETLYKCQKLNLDIEISIDDAKKKDSNDE